MPTEYKFTLEKAMFPIKQSWGYYIMLLLYFIISVFFSLALGGDFRFGYFILVYFYLVFLVLQIALQIQYYVKDKDKSFAIDYGRKSVTLRLGSQVDELTFDEIKCIEYFKGSKFPSVWGRHVIPSNFYHWTRITSYNGKTYSFSDFIIGDIKIYGIERRTKVIPFINFVK